MSVIKRCEYTQGSIFRTIEWQFMVELYSVPIKIKFMGLINKKTNMCMLT